MDAPRRPTSTSLPRPWASASLDHSHSSHPNGQASLKSATGYAVDDGSDYGDGSHPLHPPPPARVTPALSYFQAYTPLAKSAMPSAAPGSSSGDDDTRPAGLGRRMSRFRVGSVDDPRPAQTAAAFPAPKLTSRSSSSKEVGRPPASSASRPSATRSASTSRPATDDRSAVASSSSGRHASSQQRSATVNGRTDSGSSPARKSRSDALGSAESQETGSSSPRGNVTFADPRAAAAKLRAVAAGNSGGSSRPAGPVRSASATSPFKSASTADPRRLHKSSSSSAATVKQTPPLRSDFAMLRGEGQGPPEITAVGASTNAVERRIFLDAHEREKDRLRQQQDFVRERQRTLLKDLEVTKALPGLLKGEKPPKSKEQLECEERHRREKAANLRSSSDHPNGSSRSQRSTSSSHPSASSSDGRSRPSASRSSSAVSPSRPKLAHRLSSTSDISTRSRDMVPPSLSKREQLNIRTIDEIIKTGLDQEVLLHAPNPRPPRSAFAPSPSTARFDAVEVTESDSSVSELDSGTEEANRTVYLRDGKPLSWGWDEAQERARQTNVSPSSAPYKASVASILTASSASTVQQTDDPLATPSSASQGQKLHSATDTKLDMAIDSPRLTRLVTLTRAPYKLHTVSLSDVGAPDGHPVVVFLGLGGVRYLTALYDGLAQSMGLRLICIDRFGLGKSDDVPEDKRGFLAWAGVVEEVADRLNLHRFSVLAHSAGSPYAMATSLLLGERVLGSVNLLAPWVGLEVDGGYKWLRYVPAGVIKTAQAAEWRMQGWMLGSKPASPSPTTTSKAGLPPAKPSSRGSISHGSPSSSSSPISTVSSQETEGVPEEALAYMGLDDRSSPTLLDARGPETTEYPLPGGRTGSPAQDASSSSSCGKAPGPPSSTAAASGRAEFGTALLRACHAENRGGTADLLAVMRKSSEWGFSYTDVALPVRVWYGDRDEKINEKSVRWLERELADCTLIVKKGEGHNLLSSTRVIVEVLESIAAEVGRN